MKYDYFFELAKQKGIEECELKIYESYSLSFSLFHSSLYSGNLKSGTHHTKFLVVLTASYFFSNSPILIFEIHTHKSIKLWTKKH